MGRPALRARRGDLATAPEADEDAETESEQPQVAGEALIDVLDARTPLLQRAFRNVWPGADSYGDSVDRAARRGPEKARMCAGVSATNSAIAARTSNPVRRPNALDSIPTSGGPATMPK